MPRLDGGLVSNGAALDIVRRLGTALLQYPAKENTDVEALQRIAQIFSPSYDVRQRKPPVAGIGLRGQEEIVIFLAEEAFSLSENGLRRFLGTKDLFIRSRYTGRFVPCLAGGESIGYGSSTGPTGTIGCLVTDPAGDEYLLSCNHVIADLNRAKLGDSVWHPGADDGGTPVDSVGVLHDYETILFGGVLPNRMDAAVAKPNPGTVLSKSIGGGIGIIGGVDPHPAFNSAVQKYGKTTKHTRGDLLFQTISMLLPYSVGDALYIDQYGIVETTGTGAPFADSGDSGSLVVNDTGEAIGVIIAVASTGDIAVASPIDPILARFGLHF